MGRFKCPECDKALRADGIAAGDAIRCPGCGHRFAPPVEGDQAPFDVVEEEEGRPRPRKRKPFRRKPSAAACGRTAVLVIIGVVGVMQLFGVVRYLAMPDPVEAAGRQAREASQSFGKDLPEDVRKRMDRDIDKALGGALEEELRRSRRNALLWALIPGVAYGLLLLFLYLRHDWARVVLGVLFLVGAFLTFVGLFFLLVGGGLKFYGTGVAILTVLEVLFRLVVSAGIGAALMRSEAIITYTSGRR